MEGLPELGEAEDHGGDTTISNKWLSLTIMISVSIALLDVLAAGVSLVENMTATQALLAKNEASLYQNKASDQWNFYEAKAVKRSISELGITLAPPGTAPDALEKLQANVERYRHDEDDIRTQAKDLEGKAEEANQKSALIMERHHHLSIGGGLLHVSVAIASIALIVRHRWFWHGGLALGAAGVAIAIWAFFFG